MHVEFGLLHKRLFSAIKHGNARKLFAYKGGLYCLLFCSLTQIRITYRAYSAFNYIHVSIR